MIEDSEIRAAMKKYENETIQHAKSYKIPLREWQWWDFQIFYHEYVVLKTDKAWWSIEKTNKGISLQKARSEETVVKMDRQKLRCSPKSTMQPKPIKEGKANMTMLGLANIIYSQDLLHKTYNVWIRNCQGFAQDVFDGVSQENHPDGQQASKSSGNPAIQRTMVACLIINLLYTYYTLIYFN